MAGGKKKIILSIAGKSYHMAIDESKEELYCEAARRIDEKVALYAKMSNFDLQDRLAMVALRYSIEVLTSERSSALGDADIEELQTIERRIKSYVKR